MSQPDPHMYQNHIDSINKTMDQIIILDDSQYFRNNELKDFDKNQNNMDTLYLSMFDIVSNIFTELPKEYQDNPHVTDFTCDIVNNVLSNIINDKLVNHSWNFDLKNKFMWITLLHCIKSCPILIQFLLEKCNDKIQIVSLEDNNGNNLIIHSSYILDSLINIIRYTDKQLLFKQNKYGISPIDIIISNGTIKILLEEKLLSFEDLMNYRKNGMNVLHLTSFVTDNTNIIYLLNHEDLNQNDLLIVDGNQNTPAMTALIYKNYKVIHHILNSPKFTIESLSKVNLRNESVLSHYKKIPELMKTLFTKNLLTVEIINNNYKLFLDYFDESNYTNINELVQSNYFVISVLHRNDKNIFEELINKNSDCLLNHIKEGNKSVIKVINELLDEFPNMYSLICRVNIKLATILFELEIINREMLEQPFSSNAFQMDEEPYLGWNALQCIVVNIVEFEIDENEDEEEEELDEMYLNLLQKIIKSKLYNPIHLNLRYHKYILTHIFEIMPNFFLQMVKNNLIDININKKAILECLKIKSNKNIINLKKEIINHKLVNKHLIKNDNNQLLKISLKSDSDTAQLIFDNHDLLLDESSFLNYVTKKSILNYIYYVQKDKLFTQIITCPAVTTKVINWINQEGESIVDYLIKKPKRLEELIQKRPDLDKKLLYSSILLNKIVSHNLTDSLNLILSQNDVPYSYFTKLIKSVIILDNLNRNRLDTYLNEILYHKYYAQIDNILMSELIFACITKKSSNLDIILNSDNLTEKTFCSLDNSGNNILINSLIHNFKGKEIISHKYFSNKMFYSKNKDGMNTITILPFYYNYDVLDYGIKNKIIDKKMLLEGTMMKDMIDNNYVNEVINIVNYYNDKNMLIHEMDEKTNLLYHIIGKSLYIDADQLFMTGIVMDDLLNKINNELLLVRLFNNNYELFTNFAKRFPLSKKILLFPISKSYKFVMYALLKKSDFINLVPVDLIVDDQILNLKNKKIELLNIIRPNEEVFSQILNHQNFNADVLLLEKDDTLLIEKIMESNMMVGKIYFEHHKFNKNVLCINNGRLLLTICKNYPEILEVVVKRQLIEQDNIKLIHEMTATCLQNKSENTISNSLKLILDSEYLNTAILKSKYQDKSFIEYLIKKQFVIEYLLQNKKIPQELLFEFDKFGDPYIIQFRYNIDQLYDVLKYIEINLLCKKNKCGQTLLHLLAIDNCFKEILKLNIPESIYLQEDSFGKLYLDYLIEYKNDTVIDEMLDKKMITSRLASHMDGSKITIFSKLLETFPDKHDSLKYLIGNELLNITDNEGINNFGHIIKNSNVLLEYVLNIDNFDKNLLNTVDNNGRTIMMLAAQYNGKNLLTLLKSPLIKQNHMMEHKNLGSCLTKAIRYNPKTVRHILESKLMNDDILYSRENETYNDYIVGLNIIQLACKHNPEALMFILSNNNLDELVHEVIGKNPDKINSLKVAILYQPESVEILLKSKYGTNKLIKETNTIMNISCLIDAIERQPASFPILLKSGKFTNEDINFGNTDPINELHRIVKIRHDRFSLTCDYYEMLPIMKYKNDPCASNDSSACGICSANKCKVIFDTCGHKCCVSCSMRINKCHLCRANINNRIVYE